MIEKKGVVRYVFCTWQVSGLQGLAQGNDELTEFLADNFTSVAGGAFYIMDADPSNGTDVDLLEMLEELDTSGFTIGLTSFHYLKSTWAMGGM